MCTSEQQRPSMNTASAWNDESLRLPLAISPLPSKIHRKQPSLPDAQPEADALRWKRKAKERKLEIIRLREDLREAEEASHSDLFPPSASCKCYFFDDLGKSSAKRTRGTSNPRFSDVLRRRFFRQVRAKERRKAGVLSRNPRLSELPYEDEIEQLRASVDFLVELCEKDVHGSSGFCNWSHQAVDFILVSLKNLLAMRKNLESIEGIVNGLIMRLVRHMCSDVKGNESEQTDNYSRTFIQHLIRKLGSESYIGQRVIFSAAERISVLAESLFFMDPFDESYAEMHECMFILIQLMEFLIADNLPSWSEDTAFDPALFGEWAASVLHAKNAVEQLENRNSLYVLYLDRVIGELAKQVGQSSSLQKLKPDILHH